MGDLCRSYLLGEQSSWWVGFFFFFHSLFLIFDFDFARPLEHEFTDFFWVDLLLLN